MRLAHFLLRSRKHLLPKVILTAVLFASPAIWANPQLDTIDTPTAASLSRGSYSISVWGYNNGGIFTRAIMGIHDNIFLGVSFDIQNVIGSDTLIFNIPGVIARIKISDGWNNFPLLIAVGYDAFYANEKAAKTNKSWTGMRMVYGPYVALTKPIFLFKGEQHISTGVRVPVQPSFNSDDISCFLSFDFPIGQFIPMFEIERIFFSNKRLDEVLVNAGFRFELYEDIAVELNLVMGINKPSSRILTFEYVGSF